jgi:hypothetical protein
MDMDPNATLEQIRVLLVFGDNEAVADELAELVSSLDEWLSKGGFLPQEWER